MQHNYLHAKTFYYNAVKFCMIDPMHNLLLGSAKTLSYAVADPGGVLWVLWNPSFCENVNDNLANGSELT